MKTSTAIITGPPGSGKTTIARSIAASIGAAHVEEDVLYDLVPSLDRSHASLAILPDLIAALCSTLSAQGFPILIEGLFFDATLVEALQKRLGIKCIIALSVTIDRCLARNLQRMPGGIVLAANEVEKLHVIPRPNSWKRVSANEEFDVVLKQVAETLRSAKWPT